MTTPCEQRDKIDAISHTLERMENTQERLVALLEKVANQDARLDHVEEHAENTYKDLNEVFTRLRECELNQAANSHDRINTTLEELSRKVDALNPRLERLLTAHRIFTGKYAIYFYCGLLGLIVLGFVSDVANHWEWIKAIWMFWKG